MHDEGTGGNTNGGYGIFPLFPLQDCSFESCPVRLGARQALRAAGADGLLSHYIPLLGANNYCSIAARPGYFTTTFVNGIKIETTSTRRAGLIKFTYSTTNSTAKHVVVDLTNDLQRSFKGGSIDITSAGHVKLGGTFQQVVRPFECVKFILTRH
jgi:hypothetical protein